VPIPIIAVIGIGRFTIFVNDVKFGLWT